MAVLGLLLLNRLSLFQRARATLHCSAWASHCGGFSCGAQTLGTWASVVVVSGL